MKLFCLRLLPVVLLAHQGSAATVTWINPAGGNWSDTNSWSGAAVPGPADDVSISLAGNYSVLLDGTETVQSLALGGAGGTQILTNAAGSLTFTTGVVVTNGLLAMGGGVVSGQLLLQGSMIWTAGAVGPGGALTVAQGGLLTLAGPTNTLCEFEAPLTNGGIFRVTSGNLQLLGPNYSGAFSGELINLPGGLVDLQADVSINNYSGELFINQGVVRKSGGTGVSVIAPIIDFSGTLDTPTGIVSLTGGGSLTGAQLTGAGTNVFTTGTYMLGGMINASNAVLAGATLAGSNGFLGGNWTWTSGGIGPASSLAIATNGLLALAGSAGSDYVLEGTLTNFGTIRLTSGNLQILGPNYSGNYTGELINMPGGLVDFRSDVSIDHYSGEDFINQGLVVKSGGSGVSLIGTAFKNTGTLDVQSGTLALAGGGDGTGQFISETGTTLKVSAGYEMDSSSITGAGTNLLTGGAFFLDGSVNVSNVVLAGASLGGTNGIINGTLTWTSGSIAAGSTLTVASNAVLLLAGATNSDYAVEGILTNAGTIRVLSGNLQLLGPSYDAVFDGELVNLPGALLDFQSDASLDRYSGELFINQGVVRKSGGTGVSTINPTLKNSGILDARTGAISQAGGGSEDSASLTGAGTNLFTSGTYALSGSVSSSNAVLAGASFTGANAALSGLWTWSSGSIAPGSTLAVATNGILALAGQTNADYQLLGALTNAGTIRLVSGNLQLLGPNYSGSYSGELINLPGGLVDLQSDVSIDHYNGELFINQGLVRKSGGTGVSTIGPAFQNTGALDVLTGTVILAGSGSGNGQFTAEAGASLNFSAGYLMNNATLAGAGTNALTGGVFTLDGGANSGNVFLAGASLAGSNAVISTMLTWTSGSIAAGSTVTVASNAVLVLAGQTNSDYQMLGALTNAGTIRLVSGNMQILGPSYSGAYSGMLVNLPGALVDIAADSSIDHYSGELLINQGVVRKSGGKGLSSIGPTFNNTGELDVQTGAVTLAGGGVGNGQFIAEAGASLNFSAGYEMDNASMTGAGTNFLTGGTFTLNGGANTANVFLAGATLNGTNGVLGGFWTWTGGEIAPASSLTVPTNGVFVLAGATNSDYELLGALTNAGTIRLASGNLQILGPSYSGGYTGELINQRSGLVDLQSDVSIDHYSGELLINQGVVRKSGGTGVSKIGPTLENTGVLDAQSGVISLTGSYSLTDGDLNFGLSSLTSFGQINLPGAAALDGTVSANFNNGYSPIEGNSFGVLTYGLTNGVFTNFVLPGRIAWATNYSATTLTLTVLNVAPTLAPLTNQAVRELTPLAAVETAADPDLPPQSLTFGLVSGPAGLTIDSHTGLISWTPAQTESPSTNTVVVSVTDNGTPPLSASNTFQVAVIEVNTAPVLGALAAQSVIQQTPLALTNSAAESNIHATLAYSLVNPPAGAAIDANGVIHWTPGPSQAPSTNIIVTVAANTDIFDLVNPHLSATNSVTVVARAIPVITWAAPADISYGTALSAAQLGATANVSGTFAYTPALGTVLAAGSSQTLSVAFTPADLSGYTTATATVKLNVHPARPTVTWANPADITYPKPLGATQLNAMANVPGTFAYAPPSGTVLAAGAAQTIAVTFTPTDTVDYTSVTTNAAINVLKAALAVTANNTNRVYGAANPSFAAGFSGFVNGDGPSVLSGTPALTTTATAGSPVGSYPITTAQGTLAAANYSFSFANGTLTVTPSSLTVTANSTNRVAGASNPVFTAAITGFVNGDGAAVVSGTPSFSTTATSGSPAGTYPVMVTQGTLSATNYLFGNFVPGLLTVTSSSGAVTLISPSMKSGTFSVSLESATGSTYILEFKDSLTTPAWTEGQSLPGTSGLITLADSTAGPVARFYRVRITTP